MLKYDKWFFVGFVIPFLLDRLTKYWIVAGVWSDTELTSFLDIYLTYNRGIAWGMGNSLGSYGFFLLSTTVIFMLWCFVWYMYKFVYHHKMMLLATYAITSGGVANVIDRFWYGGVVDFIHVHVGSYSFPVFNVADIFISLGTAVLCYFLWYESHE